MLQQSRMPAPFVALHVLGPLRRYCGGQAELRLAAATVREVLQVLERHEPTLYRNICDETGAVRRHLNVFVNTLHVRDLDGLDTSLAEGDVVSVLPAVSGG